MNIRTFLILSFLLLLRILFTQHYVYAGYWIALVSSTVFLQSRKLYRDNMNSSIRYFFFYLLFVIVWRTGEFVVSRPLQYGINIAEHALFTITVCFMISLYVGLLKHFNASHSSRKLIITALLFNTIGFINEMYQSFAQHGKAFLFSTDAKKDLLVNFVASLLFVIVSVFSQKQNEPDIMKTLDGQPGDHS